MNALIAEHCTKPPRSVLYDADADLLLDVASGKTLKLAGTLKAVEARTDPQTTRPYLALVLGDGRPLALADAGIAFAPGFLNTGPLAELPGAVCWKDFHSLLQQLKHELYGHPDLAPSGSTVRVLMCCLAIVDGARDAGFDVGPEERELEWHLRELERRAPSP